MAAGLQAALDRVTALVASTASLADDGSGRTAFERAPSRVALLAGPDQGVHRRFHVLYGGSQSVSGGRFACSYTDTYVDLVVEVGYYQGGGSRGTVGGEQHGVDRLAADDLDRLRQHVEHPTNYDTANTGIQLIEWTGTKLAALKDERRVYEVSFRVWVEHARLT